MNYSAHYERLIERAKHRALTGYVERHHVVPRCMGGNDDSINIVRLTAEEHYVVHQLLVKMYPEHRGLALAAMRMATQCTSNKAYGWLRRRVSELMKGTKNRVGTKHSVEAKAKMSLAKRGIKLSDAHRANLSAARKGRKKAPRSAIHSARISAALKGRKRGPFSLETRLKMSARQRGKPKPGLLGNKNNLGKKASLATRAKMSASRIGRLVSLETRMKMSVSIRAALAAKKQASL